MAPTSASLLRFGQSADGNMVWSFRRNCAIRPAQLLGVFAFLSAVSLSVATVFWMYGATYVLPFAFLEVTVLGIAFVAYARHATDGEIARLEQNWLVIEQEIAGKRVENRFQGHGRMDRCGYHFCADAGGHYHHSYRAGPVASGDRREPFQPDPR